MRTNDVLKNENSSPYLKRLVLMKRAGIELSPRQLNKLNESVSMVQPTPKHERDKVQGSMMKHLRDLDDDEELDLSELFDEEEESDDELFDQILREMGYGEEEDDMISMEDIPPVTDEELESIIKDLEYASGEDDINEFNTSSKGYKEARKLVDKLRRDLFRKLDNNELDEFMDVLSYSFDLQRR